jgi:A/G-specific adenine glycosylase
MPNASMNRQVIASLFSWYEQHGRHSLPWRKTRDPYKVLVSELMLQQTQVPRVVPKYEAFIEHFPTIEKLAAAERAQVLQLWQGLGYNSRAIRLHELAKANKRLPESRDDLLKLPGIGPYTAGAVMIFAHDKPSLSVDVNVERVLKRVFWSRQQLPEKQEVNDLSLQLITQSGKPHHWHCALMDLGSAICTARNPRCNQCPLFSSCKTRGMRPEELARKAKQSRFVGSNRWWRGQILKLLLAGPVKKAHLLHKIKERPDAGDEDACAAALASMVKEGIAEDGTVLKLR